MSEPPVADMTGAEPPEDEVLAAEHALGVLSARERAAAETRMAVDPAFAADVETWRARLAPLAGGIAEVAPPEGLWSRIERALPANDNTGAVAGLRRVRFWRGATVGSLALAAATLVVAFNLASRPPVVIRTPPPPPSHMMNARLASTGGDPMFLAAYDPDRRQVLVASLVPPGADPDHSHELWLIPSDGKPRSLGLVEPGASKMMAMPEPMAPMMEEGVSLAVSVEPAGGSQQDGPSGPIAAVGKLQPL